MSTLGIQLLPICHFRSLPSTSVALCASDSFSCVQNFLSLLLQIEVLVRIASHFTPCWKLFEKITWIWKVHRRPDSDPTARPNCSTWSRRYSCHGPSGLSPTCDFLSCCDRGIVTVGTCVPSIETSLRLEWWLQVATIHTTGASSNGNNPSKPAQPFPMVIFRKRTRGLIPFRINSILTWSLSFYLIQFFFFSFSFFQLFALSFSILDGLIVVVGLR